MQKGMHKKNFLTLLWILIVVFYFSSCVSSKRYKDIPYFNDISDSSKPVLAATVPFEYPTIKPDDILLITVESFDPEANVLFASGNASVAASGASAGASTSLIQPSLAPAVAAGHLVDNMGNLTLPVIGTIHVAGLTTTQARDLIKTNVDKFYPNSTVDVRYNNFKISVMGEVARPATYIVPNEKVTLFDALSLAGDLTIFGKRENVLLIRDSAGQKLLARLDIRSKNIVSSPYFYLKQNDVLYVEPNKYKSASVDAVLNRQFTVAAAVLSVIIVVATRIK